MMMLPRFRFTVRRMMVAVAIIGVWLAFNRLLIALAIAASRNTGDRTLGLAWLVEILFNGLLLWLIARRIHARLAVTPPAQT